jgi:hypothetical protein
VTLDRFPVSTLRGDRGIYRIHRSGKDPWWFSADGTGRFDPVGTGSGACYFASEPLGAWVEVFRKQLLLAEGEILERSLCSVSLGHNLRLADVTSRRALEFGVTASLGANEKYAQSHDFAGRVKDAGFDGIRYFLRHDPAQKLFGYALFSAPGLSGSLMVAHGSATDEEIPAAVIEQAQRVFGYRVLPTP